MSSHSQQSDALITALVEDALSRLYSAHAAVEHGHRRLLLVYVEEARDVLEALHRRLVREDNER